ncbi:MAG: class 1 fructose-bisphosphatase [Bdellovibrionales bacterium]|nr:class 1 fructose-bisphosphatase [Bdellovibrionales bacterium]
MLPIQTLTRFIYENERDFPDATGELSSLLASIALGVKVIARLVATAGVRGLTGYTGHVNVQGEQTYKLDEEADAVLVDILGSSGCFGSLVSEERDAAQETSSVSDSVKYVVAFDPLDGSSNIGTNIPVGTIFTVFRRRDMKAAPSAADFMQPGRDIVAAGYSVYGAKTSFVYSAGYGVHGFTLDPSLGEFILTDRDMKVPQSGDTFSINEGYWSQWEKSFQNYLHSLKTGENDLKKVYSGRYVGSLVADFDRTLRKGGIFLHPANTKRPRGKLRLLYECIPLAFIMKNAGGIATDGKIAVTDIEPQAIHERCPLIVGSTEDVEMFLKAVG